LGEQADSAQKESVAEIFSRAASGFDRKNPRFFSHFGNRLVDLAHVAPGAKVLDVATGRGAILFPAENRVGSGGFVIGVDIASGMVREIAAEVQRASLKHVMICQMDAEHLAFPSASLDDVFCGNAIFYFPGALSEFLRILIPGGQVGISVIAKGSLDWVLETLQPYIPEPDNRNENEDQDLAINTPNGLENLFSQAGFEKLRLLEEEARFTYASEEEWWLTLWTLGCSGMMEAMTPASLEGFKQDIYERLQVFKQPDGIEIPIRVLFALGAKPI
jgi:O-methyltransferase / aklanonic acid methyltransferase